MRAFEPLHVARAGSIRLHAPPDEVFPLFTPVGETRWVPGWSPAFLHPSTGEAREGTTFLTRADGEGETIWMVMEHDAPRRVVYARVTPSSRAGRVEVRCEPAEDGTTIAHVRYTFTALSDHGNDYLAALTDEAYRGWMEEWERRVNGCLAGAGV
jgi:Polyketide cyclase / dehydrase and lipid transport